MTELSTPFADAEKATIDYLMPHLTRYGGGVGIGVTKGPGSRFVRVRRVGGSGLTPNHDLATMDVLVWHDNDRERMRLAQFLWAALRDAANAQTPEAHISYASTVLGPRQMPDPADATKSVCLFTVSVLTRSR